MKSRGCRQVGKGYTGNTHSSGNTLTALVGAHGAWVAVLLKGNSSGQQELLLITIISFEHYSSSCDLFYPRRSASVIAVSIAER